MNDVKGNYIKLYRSLLEWEWFKDSKTLVVFLYLICRANWKPNRWRGIEINRGQTLETLPGIANATGLSVQSVRTALNHLKSTGEITDKLTAHGRLINVVNYDKYQDTTDESNRQINSDLNSEATGNQQGINSQSTVLEEGKKINNVNKEKNKNKDLDLLVNGYSDNDEIRTALHDFIEMRMAIGRPLTERGLKGCLTTLDQNAEDDDTKLKIIEKSIECNWKTFYPLNSQKNGSTWNSPKSTSTAVKIEDYEDIEEW